MLLVPVSHDLIDAPTEEAARQSTHLLDPMAKEGGAWRKRRVIDVAVEGLIHSINQLCHGRRISLEVFV
jgi:hypothetical protein